VQRLPPYAKWGLNPPLTAMPNRTLWSKEELIVAIYFLSRLIHPKTVRCLLLRRGYNRSIGAIERKALSVAQQHPYLRSSEGHWDVSAADHWLDDLLGDHESVNRLVQFSSEDAKDVASNQAVDDLLNALKISFLVLRT
jgi:hypothetical protein